jgi:hypothetical protein
VALLSPDSRAIIANTFEDAVSAGLHHVVHSDDSVSKHTHNSTSESVTESTVVVDEAGQVTAVDDSQTLSSKVIDEDRYVSVSESDDVLMNEANQPIASVHVSTTTATSKVITTTVYEKPSAAPKSFADMVKNWGKDETSPSAGTSSAPSVTTTPPPVTNTHKGKNNHKHASTSAPAPVATAQAATSDEAEVVVNDKPVSRQRNNANVGALYVSQVPATATEADLRNAISPFAQVTRVDLSTSKGIAFVDVAGGAEGVARVVAHAKAADGGFSIGGHKIRVDEKTQRANKSGGDKSGNAKAKQQGGNKEQSEGGSKNNKKGNKQQQQQQKVAA